MQTGNRAYHDIERKSRRRQVRRANKGAVSKRRRRSAHDRLRALRLKGEA